MAQFRMTDPKTRKGDSLTAADGAADHRDRAGCGPQPPRAGAAPRGVTAPGPALRCLDGRHNPAADTRPAGAHQADGKSPDHQAC